VTSKKAISNQRSESASELGSAAPLGWTVTKGNVILSGSEESRHFAQPHKYGDSSSVAAATSSE
jgi:hypothetical protein